MANFFESLFGANWRTSLSGWIKGLLLIIGDLIQAYQTGSFNGLNGMALVFAIMVIVSGHLTKDKKTDSTPQ